MDRFEAMTLLPPTYAVALRLLDTGSPPETVAVALGVDPQAVDPLVRIAEQKLRAILDEPADRNDRDGTDTTGGPR